MKEAKWDQMYAKRLEARGRFKISYTDIKKKKKKKREREREDKIGDS